MTSAIFVIRGWPVKYGEVYFRAWQQLYKTGGPKLLDFEHNCIQDLMSVAFQAQPGIFPAFRKVCISWKCNIFNHTEVLGKFFLL